MDHRKTTLERAFELAKTGVYANFGEVRTKIKSEGYDVRQMDGLSLRKQINRIVQSARENAHPGQERPAELIGNASPVMRIGAGEEADGLPDANKGPEPNGNPTR